MAGIPERGDFGEARGVIAGFSGKIGRVRRFSVISLDGPRGP
jgi:hypothetical protein